MNAIQALSQLSYGPDPEPGFSISFETAGPTGLEPATSGVTVRHSNRLSYGPLSYLWRRAGNRARTGDLNLGKVALYQLSYARMIRNRFAPSLRERPLRRRPRKMRCSGARAIPLVTHPSGESLRRSFTLHSSDEAGPPRSHGESNPGLHLERVAS